MFNAITFITEVNKTKINFMKKFYKVFPIFFALSLDDGCKVENIPSQH